MRTIIFCMLIGFTFFSSAKDMFTPGKIWLDNNGNPINAHGGGIIKSGDKYYWFGEKRNPGGLINKVNVYSSKDLYNWKYDGIALDLAGLPVRHDLERPKVIYNKKNKNYVMWVHIELNGHYSTGKAGVAVSKNIIGPYKFVSEYWPNPNIMPIKRDGDTSTKNIMDADRRFKKYFSRGQMFRDFTAYVDTNGKAYLIYESEDDVSLQVAELNDDYTNFDGRYSRILVGDRNEAPAMFKRNNKYFLITSGLHGFTPTDARLATADDIFGPWTPLGNPAKSEDKSLVDKTFYSQSNFVLKVDNQYIFMGDRWNKKDLTKSTYVWLPIKWQNNLPYLNWYDSWRIDKDENE